MQNEKSIRSLFNSRSQILHSPKQLRQGAFAPGPEASQSADQILQWQAFSIQASSQHFDRFASE
jgi:hypothetical protein